jgi:hypothetical protein
MQRAIKISEKREVPLRNVSSVPRWAASRSLAKDGWDTTALSLWLSIHPTDLADNIGGIPHLAKKSEIWATRQSLRNKR